MSRFSPNLLCLVGLALGLAACDVTTSADDVSVLLTDARLARQSGDLATAERLLEQAYGLAPSDAAVRVELSAVYFEREGIDLLDLDRVALHLTRGAAPLAPQPSVARFGDTCVYDADPNATLFDPTEVEGYTELVEDRDVVQTVLDLLHGTDPSGADLSIMPAALRSVGLCGGIEDGQLLYDRDGALAQMRALGLTDLEITSALAVNAVARLLDGYFFLTEDLPQQTTWYRVDDGSGESFVGVCAADPEALRLQANTAVADIGEALTSLDLRAYLLGGDGATQELVEHAVAAYEAVAPHLGPYCE